MLVCPNCSAAVVAGATCPACGAAPPRGSRAAATPQEGKSSSPRRQPRRQGEPRFVSGAIVAGRYRVVGLLGTGGMGEVYRADDLKLGQVVALKFLPETLGDDPAVLANFHQEVSLARRVSHRNVCRVFDVGEVDGHHFLTMEFIDGEDLAALRRRIGRLPADKGLEIARQLCAGLAAIHDAGVLHRDLKPANVMLDGRGRARITDFGVADFAGELPGGAMVTGTPGYMAPEQAARGETTVRSDVYSLGLVLYEMFTGRRPFPEAQRPEPTRPGTGTRPPSPATVVPDVDPQTAGAILRCLEADPRARPASVLEVAALLPGGSPLAAALAAGETPSPDMIVAAPKVGSLRPWVAVACLAGVVLGLALIFALAKEVRALSQIPFDRPPEVLADRARNLLASLGHDGAPVGTAAGFGAFEEYGRFLREHGAPGGWARERLASGRPPLVYFWYRQSPRHLVPVSLEVKPDDPPRKVPGEALVVLDPEGRLQYLEVVPSPGSAVDWAQPADWSVLLAAAGLPAEALSPAASRALPPVYADSRVAWTGDAPGSGGPPIPLRFEAASYGGDIVFFNVLAPWGETARAGAALPGRADGPGPYMTFFNAFFLAVVVTGALLTRRNLRLERGDRRGARRLAWFTGSVTLLGWLVGGNHVSGWAERDLMVAAVGLALSQAALLWITYIGLEPYLRRDFPERIIAWTRLLAGNVKDPLVGRDLLAGCLLGIGITLSYDLRKLAEERLARGSGLDLPDFQSLSGLSSLVHHLSGKLFIAVIVPLSFMVLFLLLRVLLRREAVAVVALWVLFTALMASRGLGPNAVFGLAFVGFTAAIYIFVWTRFGLLAGIAGHMVFMVTRHEPLTSDLGAWYGWVTLVVVASVLALATYGFSTSVAGQPLLRGVLLED